MYRLHGTLQSRTMRPLWMLEELELPYTLLPAEPRSPEAFAVSPLGKVPVLETDEGIIVDSVAQMTFLADRHGGFTHPAGSYLRARQDAVTNTINETLDAVLWANVKHIAILPEEHRVEAIVPSLRWQFARNGTALAQTLGAGPFLMGDRPLLPDILLAHCCQWAARRGFEVNEALRRHMTLMRARPAFRRATSHG